MLGYIIFINIKAAKAKGFCAQNILIHNQPYLIMAAKSTVFSFQNTSMSFKCSSDDSKSYSIYNSNENFH